MNNQSELRRLGLDEIVQRCAEESRLFFKGQPCNDGYCYELFRRAIVERNSYAWDAVYQQYRNLVSGWVRRSSGFEAAGGDAEELVNFTFTKLWRSLTPAKFSRFDNLQAVLRYLQMCAGSAVTDRVRRRRYEQFLEPLEDFGIELSNHHAEQAVLSELERARFWANVREHLNDEQEEVLVYSYFILGLKPRQIFDRFSEQFDAIEDVYRVKRNVLHRLRRSPELQMWWEFDAE
jgi:DNA-directed RNA polymerase specialized sigma24 family protein